MTTNRELLVEAARDAQAAYTEAMRLQHNSRQAKIAAVQQAHADGMSASDIAEALTLGKRMALPRAGKVQVRDVTNMLRGLS